MGCNIIQCKYQCSFKLMYRLNIIFYKKLAVDIKICVILMIEKRNIFLETKKGGEHTLPYCKAQMSYRKATRYWKERLSRSME